LPDTPIYARVKSAMQALKVVLVHIKTFNKNYSKIVGTVLCGFSFATSASHR